MQQHITSLHINNELRFTSVHNSSATQTPTLQHYTLHSCRKILMTRPREAQTERSDDPSAARPGCSGVMFTLTRVKPRSGITASGLRQNLNK